MGRPMQRARLAGAIAATLLCAACAHAPRSFDESLTTLAIRADFLETHPAGKYNANIARGEVSKGMDYFEVLAAWGVPERRARNEDARFELWGYVAVDEVSQDWTQYTFVFEKQTLVGWEITRHVNKGHALEQWESPEPPGNALDPESHPADVTGLKR
ncbi:MAG: hypothetical protein OEO21_11975 [Candidatus Krumholzibacteria bacterium]|nr:hypothetical protein [Candidatus Krumholzibacteria bacterium]